MKIFKCVNQIKGSFGYNGFHTPQLCMDCQALGLVWQPFGPIIRICWSSNAFSHFFSFGSVLKIEDLGRYGSRLSRSIWLSLRCLGRFWRGLSGLRISFVAFSEREISMAFLFQKFQEVFLILISSIVSMLVGLRIS